jgi:outer membrane protein assembly complex protein YaeT
LFRLKNLLHVCAISSLVIAAALLRASADDKRNIEDPVFRVNSLEISGNTALSDDDVRKAMKLKVPAKMRQSGLNTSYQKLLDAYHNRGFLDVAISTTFAEAPEGVSIGVEISEGDVFYLGTLSVEGNKELRGQTILREMEMKPGDVLNKGKLIDGNQRLYASGCFDMVDMVISTAPAHRMNVVLKVRERQQRFLKGGAGYGSQSKERVTAGFEDRNFFGGDRRLDMKYTLSGFWTRPDKNFTSLFDTTVVQPFIFNTRMEGQLGYQRQAQQREAYDSISNTVRSSLERRITAAFSIKETYRFSGTHLTRGALDTDTLSLTSIDAVGINFRYDNTDDPFLPSKGWRSITFLEEGLEMYTTDIGFHKFEARLGRFDTIDSGWTFFEGAQFGHIRPWSGRASGSIPIYERYFIGGANTVRGYSERTLGPKDRNGDPLGGTLFMVGNLEIRHKIYKLLHGVLFLDGGNLYAYDPGNAATDVKIRSTGDLKYGTGAGLRLHSPIGAVRLEVGYQLNPDGNSSTLDRFAVHFSIGEVF